MKIIITESQYVIITEDIEKERYKKLVSELLKTLFGELTIEHEYDDSGDLSQHILYDKHREEFATIYVGAFANKGCKKDLTLTQESSEKLEGYIPYLRHKLFSKVLIELIDDKFKIKCDCIQYDYNFEREIRHSDDEDDEEEYEYVNYDTRKYNIKKKKKIKESVDKSNVVEQIMNVEGIKYDGCEYDGRNRDSFGRTHDSVVFYFEFPNDYKHRSIRFLTKNNKVVGVSSSSDFRTITDGFKYIPTNILKGYFIEKAKTYLEETLSDRYPNDNLKESIIKEDNLKTTLLNMIETDGWEDTSELVGGYENLLNIVGEDKIINLLLSCFSDLNVKKMGNDIILRDNHLPILEKPSSFWGLPLKVFNDNIEIRLEVKFGSDITKVYRNVRREFIRELVSLFPDLYTSDVNVYKDNGLYVKYDSFSLN